MAKNRISVAFRSTYRGVTDYDAFACGHRVGIITNDHGCVEYRTTEFAAPLGITTADIAAEYRAERIREDEHFATRCADRGLDPAKVRADIG